MILQTNFSRVGAALDNFLCHQNSGQRYTIPNPATNNKNAPTKFKRICINLAPLKVH